MRILQVVHGFPLHESGLARICAAQALESTRLSQALDGLWQKRARANLAPYLLDLYEDSWRTLAYFAIRHGCLAYYRATLNQAMTWLLPLKNRLKQALLGEAQLRVVC